MCVKRIIWEHNDVVHHVFFLFYQIKVTAKSCEGKQRIATQVTK